VQLATLPALPARDKPNLRVLGQLLLRPGVRVALLAVLLIISGHFAGFTYIRPLMENITHLSVQAVTAILLGYGIGGFFGNLVGGAIAQRSERRAIMLGGAVIALLAAGLLVAGTSAAYTAVAIVLWGFAFGAFPVGFQTWIVRAAPEQAEGAGGLMVAALVCAHHDDTGRAAGLAPGATAGAGLSLPARSGALQASATLSPLRASRGNAANC
jgi:predicted MFS family arabinose efflux permease